MWGHRTSLLAAPCLWQVSWVGSTCTLMPPANLRTSNPCVQDLALGVYMPPPLDRLLKRICCNQTKRIFEDVQR